MSTRYTYDENNIVYEALDTDVVLINLELGYYYILEGTATDIWKHIIGGATVDETVENLLGAYTGGVAEIQEAVNTLVAELTQESLLIPAIGGNAQAAATPATPAGATKKRFQKPAMLKHTDMQHLIQLEPVWEYDDTGWPTRGQQTPSTKK